MDSIRVTKPNMGTLDPQRPALSPFGALAQAFAQELIDRAEPGEGRYSRAALDFLEEPAGAETAPAQTRQDIRLDVQVILNALRREEGGGWHQVEERLLARLDRLRKEQEKRPLSHTAVNIRQSFYQTVWQHASPKADGSPAAPGRLGRSAERFSGQVRGQTARPAQKSVPGNVWSENAPAGRAPALPKRTPEGSIPPQRTPFSHAELTLPEPAEPTTQTAVEPVRRMAERTAQAALDRAAERVRAAAEREKRNDPRVEAKASAEKPTSQRPGRTDAANAPESGAAARQTAKTAAAKAKRDGAAQNTGTKATARADGMKATPQAGEPAVEKPTQTNAAKAAAQADSTAKTPNAAQVSGVRTEAAVGRAAGPQAHTIQTASGRDIRTANLTPAAAEAPTERAVRPVETEYAPQPGAAGAADAANAPEGGAAARQTAKTAAAKAKRDGAAQNTGTKATARADGMKATPQAGEPAAEKPAQTDTAKAAATQADSAGRMPNAAQVSGIRTEAAAGRAAGPQAHTIQTASGRDIRTANLTPAAAEAPTERIVRPVETEYAPQPGAAGAADAASAPESGAAARQTAKTAAAKAKRDGAAQNTGTKATARADGMKATPQAGEPAAEKPTQTNAAKAATQADSAGRMPNAAQVSGVRTEAAAGRAAGPQVHTIQTASGRDIRTANLTPAAAEAPTERAVRPVETEYAPQPGAAGAADAANAPEGGAAARQTAKTVATKAKRDGAAQNAGAKAAARMDGRAGTANAQTAKTAAQADRAEKPAQTNAAKAATQADSTAKTPNAAQASGVRTEAAAGRAAGPQVHTIQTASGRDIRTANLTPAAAEAPTERAVRPVETEYAPQPGAAGAADAANAPEGGAAARQTAKTAFAQPGVAPLSSTAHPQAGASGPHSAGPMLSRESASAPQTAGSAAAYGQMPGLAGMEAAMVNGPELALRAEREDVPQSAGAFPPISTPSAEPSAKRAVRPTELGHASRTGLARPTGDIRTFRPRTKQPVTERAAERLGGGPELTYRQTAAEPVRPAPQEPEESEYVRKLPDWARRFLRSSAGQGGTVPSAPVKQPTPAGAPQGGEQIRWTAPAYAPPEPMELREKTRPARQETPAAPPQLSQAELERAADQVYRMIEDRIRRERRRMGL